MTNLLELYEFAENHNIDVDWVPLTASKSLSMPFPDGSYGIAVDPWKMDTLEIETVLLSHELGHCMTGSFYNKYATCDVRRKHENRADNGQFKISFPRRNWTTLWRTGMQISGLLRSTSMSPKILCVKPCAGTRMGIWPRSYISNESEG